MKDAIERELLLQIKRNWTKDEIVGELLREKNRIEHELGVVKSELAEAVEKIIVFYITNQNNLQKITSLEGQIESMRKTKRDYKTQAIEWRNKYFSLKNGQ